MKLRKITAITAAAAAALSLAACGGTASTATTSAGASVTQTGAQTTSTASGSATTAAEGGVLNVSVAGDPHDFNPITSTTAQAHDLMSQFFETLVRQNKDGKIEQGSGLADSWTISDDQLTYTFKLKDGITWSDGTPITADQFVYCWDTVLAPDSASGYAYMLYPIKNAEEYNTGKITDPSEVGVKALDDSTLEVTLAEPTPYFLGMLTVSQFGALPVNSVEDAGDDFFMDADHMYCNGPFICTEYNVDQNMVLEKNPNYWDADSVKLSKINVNFVQDTNTIVNLYETGDLDYMEVMPEFIPTYEKAKNYVTIEEPVTEYLRFNFKNEYFANENIRRAFSEALNRDTYINQVMQNGCVPAYAFIPDSMAGKGDKTFREDVGDLFYDAGNNADAQSEAKDLLKKGLEEVGKSFDDFNGSGLSLVIGEGDANLKTAQVFQQTWKDVLGVDVEVKSEAYDLRQQEYNSGDWTLSKEGWGADYDDPMSFLELFESNSTYNDTGYSDPDYDALIEKARTMPAGDDRTQVLEDAEKKLIGDDFAIAPTFFQARHFVAKDNVHDIYRHGISPYVDFKWAYVE